MVPNLHEQWLIEVQKSLKVETVPAFIKKITDGAGISPFSLGQDTQFLQKQYAHEKPFLAIQNFSELSRSGLTEWLAHPDVGLRFRQLDDIPCEELIRDKKLFLSQPFLFLPTAKQMDVVHHIENMKAHLNFGWSPLSFGLTRGEILKKPLKGLQPVVDSLEMQSERMTWFYLSSAPYQWAGGEPHAELGILLSVACETLREMDACKMGLAESVKKLSFGLALGTDVVVEPAKIIALRLLFQKLIALIDDEIVAVSPAIYAMPSLRVYSARQPWNNLIRSVLMCSSAIIGGADGFKCIPYDVLNTNKQPHAIRESTNVPLLLRHEAHLQDVLNPLDGSPLFASAVDLLCARAWEFFKEIEKKGGIFETVRTGWLQGELLRQSEESQSRLRNLQSTLVGVNEFVDHRFRYHHDLSRESSLLELESIIDPLFLDKTDDEYMSVQPLMISSLTEDWEALQEKAFELQNHVLHVVKAPSPGTERRAKELIKLLNIVGIKHQTLDESQITDMIKPYSSVCLIAGDLQKETQLIADIKAIDGVRILSTTSVAISSVAGKEERSPFEIAEKIIAQMLEAKI